MTTETIIESGMRFGPFAQGTCLYVEKSRCYEAIQQDVQMAEFLLLRALPDKIPVIWIVEAKSSSPRPGTAPNFDQFIDDIRAKLTNGFLLGASMLLRRHDEAADELPEGFKGLDLRTLDFRFVLVIKGHKDEWLMPLASALSLALKPVIKAWAIDPHSVIVLNDEMARRRGLIS